MSCIMIWYKYKRYNTPGITMAADVDMELYV